MTDAILVSRHRALQAQQEQDSGQKRGPSPGKLPDTSFAR